jgi:hypothetical protein
VDHPVWPNDTSKRRRGPSSRSARASGRLNPRARSSLTRSTDWLISHHTRVGAMAWGRCEPAMPAAVPLHDVQLHCCRRSGAGGTQRNKGQTGWCRAVCVTHCRLTGACCRAKRQAATAVGHSHHVDYCWYHLAPRPVEHAVDTSKFMMQALSAALLLCDLKHLCAQAGLRLTHDLRSKPDCCQGAVTACRTSRHV